MVGGLISANRHSLQFEYKQQAGASDIVRNVKLKGDFMKKSYRLILDSMKETNDNMLRTSQRSEKFIKMVKHFLVEKKIDTTHNSESTVGVHTAHFTRRCKKCSPFLNK
jgi:hypothetical protein